MSQETHTECVAFGVTEFDGSGLALHSNQDAKRRVLGYRHMTGLGVRLSPRGWMDIRIAESLATQSKLTEQGVTYSRK